MHSGDDVLASDLKLLLPPSVPQGAQLQGLISKLRLALLSADQSTSDNADKFLARRIKARLPSAGVKIPAKYTDAFRKEVANCTDISALLFTISEWTSTSPDDIAQHILKSNPSRNMVVKKKPMEKKSVTDSTDIEVRRKTIEKKKSVTGSSTDIRKKTIEKKKKSVTRSTSTISSTTSTTKSSSAKDMKSYNMEETAPRVRRELFKTTGKKDARKIISLPRKTPVEEGDGTRKQIIFSADISKSKAKPLLPIRVPALDLPTGSSQDSIPIDIAMSPVTPAKGSSSSSSSSSARDPQLLIVAKELEEKERGNKKNKPLSQIFRNIRIKLADHGYKAKKDSPQAKKILLATSRSPDLVSFLETIAHIYKAKPLELAEILLFDKVHSPRTLKKKIEGLGEEQQKKHESIFTRGTQPSAPVVEEEEDNIDDEMAFLNSDEGLLTHPIFERKVEEVEKVEKKEKKKKKKKKAEKKADTPKNNDAVAEEPSADEIDEAPPTEANDDTDEVAEEVEDHVSAAEDNAADEEEEVEDHVSAAKDNPADQDPEEDDVVGVEAEESNNINLSPVKTEYFHGDETEEDNVVEDLTEELENPPPPPSPVLQETQSGAQARRSGSAKSKNNDNAGTKAKRRKQRFEELARRVSQVESRQSYAVSWPTLFCFSSLIVYAVLFYYVFLLE